MHSLPLIYSLKKLNVRPLKGLGIQTLLLILFLSQTAMSLFLWKLNSFLLSCLQNIMSHL